MAKRTNRVAWGLAAVLVVVLLGGSVIALRYGVQVGETRVHWHPLGTFQIGRKVTLTDTSAGPRLGKAYCLGWGAVCTYGTPKPGLAPDQHELLGRTLFEDLILN